MYEQQTKDYNCKDCKMIFQLTDRDEKHFLDKGWEIPKRCGSCRKKRREEKQQ